jgi:OmcA/MtrC family decaheme c-type cytochrome
VNPSLITEDEVIERKSFPSRLLMMWVALALLFPVLLAAQGRRRAAATPTTPAAPTVKSFALDQVEAYMTEDGIAYVRPGLKIKVNSITIGADRKPVLDLTITDDFDQPIDRLGKTTPGVVSLSYILAWYDPAARHYTAYTTRVQTTPATSPRPGVSATQAGADSGGTVVDLETGHVRYTFRTVLPAGFDATKTHTLGIYATRNLTDIVGKNYYANVEHDFRPDGGTVTDKWDKISTASCNNCHDPLSAHGGSRRDLKLCVLCHQPQTVDPDTGLTQDMKVLAHKIHMGANLPSVKAGTPYIIIGNGQSVHDFSHVVLPQDVRNCQNCHEGRTAAQKATQSELWATAPGRDACGACHDDINWVTGANHAAGPQLNDNACSSCHQPESELEFDASVKGAHTIPEKSAQLKGIKATIVATSNVTAGSKPTVVFKITNGDGSFVDGSKLATFAPIVAGPTTDYTKYYRESAVGKGIFDATAGTTTYTFTNAIPETATGTWAFSGDIYRNSTIKRGDGGADISLREAAMNPIHYVAVTGALTPRRMPATLASCNTCHDRLALHGGQRMAIEECVICHNPVESDISRRPATAGAPESISFARMIHKIHRGAELVQDFTVYGFGGTPHNYNHVEYVGDQRNCAKCHTASGFTLPLPTGTQPVITLRDYFSPQGPGTAACLGCHDGPDAAAHAYLNTTQFPGSTNPAEACATCHGTGKEWSVEKSHAR